MTVTIAPGKASGTVAAPPSKSMAHRLLIAAGLSKGQSTIHGLAPSEDILATIDCLQALGANIQFTNNTAVITGCDPRLAPAHTLLPCRESGSTLRFFIPICLLAAQKRVLTGYGRLMERPQSVYETLCQEQNLLFRRTNTDITVQGPIIGNHFTVPGNVSSQFITGLMMALPLTGQDCTITLTGAIESRSYIDLTLQALAWFHIQGQWQNEYTLLVKAGRYQACDITVEGDYSNAAFLDALTVLGGQVTVTGLWEQSLQGDRIYQQVFSDLSKQAAEISLANCPDLGPILMAVAAALHGGYFTHTARLRIKESDRGTAMAQELAKFGIEVKITENTITVKTGRLRKPIIPLCGHNDHRIVMALATLCTLTGGTIEGAEAVAKSYPDYFRQLAALGIDIKEV